MYNICILCVYIYGCALLTCWDFAKNLKVRPSYCNSPTSRSMAALRVWRDLDGALVGCHQHFLFFLLAGSKERQMEPKVVTVTFFSDDLYSNFWYVMARGGTSTNGEAWSISSDSIRTMYAGCCCHFKTASTFIAAHGPSHLFSLSFTPSPSPAAIFRKNLYSPKMFTHPWHPYCACVWLVSSWISAWSCSTSWRWDSSTVRHLISQRQEFPVTLLHQTSFERKVESMKIQGVGSYRCLKQNMDTVSFLKKGGNLLIVLGEFTNLHTSYFLWGGGFRTFIGGILMNNIRKVVKLPIENLSHQKEMFHGPWDYYQHNSCTLIFGKSNKNCHTFGIVWGRGPLT